MLFTIFALIMMKSVDGTGIVPDFSEYRLGGQQQKVEIEYHRSRLENMYRPEPYLPTPSHNYPGTPTSITTKTMTTAKRIPVVPPTSPKPKDWTFMFHDEFNLSARWAFALMAFCFSIPAIVS